MHNGSYGPIATVAIREMYANYGYDRARQPLIACLSASSEKEIQEVA